MNIQNIARNLRYWVSPTIFIAIIVGAHVRNATSPELPQIEMQNSIALAVCWGIASYAAARSLHTLYFNRPDTPWARFIAAVLVPLIMLGTAVSIQPEAADLGDLGVIVALALFLGGPLALIIGRGVLSFDVRCRAFISWIRAGS